MTLVSNTLPRTTEMHAAAICQLATNKLNIFYLDPEDLEDSNLIYTFVL